jgi:ABC-type uncharacterized transport system permease subunit
MGGAAQVAMCVASQIWQVVFASQTLQVFCLALRKKAQYVVVIICTLKCENVSSQAPMYDNVGYGDGDTFQECMPTTMIKLPF